MSVSLEWMPAGPVSMTPFSGSARLYDVLCNAFGEFPITLNSDSVPVLIGIKACGFEGAADLISAIYEYNSIVVEARF